MAISGLLGVLAVVMLSSEIAAEFLAKQIHGLNPNAPGQDQRRTPFSPRILDSSPPSPMTVGHNGLNVPGCAAASCNPLVYNQGPVLSSPVFYVMFYGNWNAQDQSLIQYLLQNLGGNSPLNLLTYYPFNPFSGTVAWGGTLIRNTPGYNTQLNDTDIRNLVMNEPAWAQKDPNGIYFVLSSPDVNATSGFCKTYCGFHSVKDTVRLIWVGNAETQCLPSCSTSTLGPNGRRGADSMASVLIHEVSEVITDGYFNGYMSDMQFETGDLCAWTFGAVTPASNGGYYNVQIGTNQYLVQQIIDYRNLGTQVCGIVHSPLPPTPQGADNCANALAIGMGTQSAQTNYFMSAAPSAPMTFQSCVRSMENDMYYKLTIASVPASCSIDTCVGDFDSVINVYTDCAATTRVACNDDYCGAQSNVTFTATQNTYIVGVASYTGSFPGVFALRVTCSGQPATLTPTPAPIGTSSAPTSSAPTTSAPTTVAPTTSAPTTSAPTTSAPTTSAPTTSAPTTSAPSTVAPTTRTPTTGAPTTSVPTTATPTTVAPTTSAPTTSAPTTSAPTTLAPTTLAPTTTVPTTQAPSTATPTLAVTLQPTSSQPTPSPTTQQPTTATPTPAPTFSPSPKPSAAPTPQPTPSPTPQPSPGPTPLPTPMPTPLPTKNPTRKPTPLPSRNPTPRPTNPTRAPSAPTSRPTLPTRRPTIPSRQPTPEPTRHPNFWGWLG